MKYYFSSIQMCWTSMPAPPECLARKIIITVAFTSALLEMLCAQQPHSTEMHVRSQHPPAVMVHMEFIFKTA